MTKHEATCKLAKKLAGIQNLYDGYKKGSISVKCLSDNIAIIVMKFVEKELKMRPPHNGVNPDQTEWLSIYYEWEREEWEEEEDDRE